MMMMMLLICADAATPPMVLSIWCVQNKLLYSLFGGNMHFFFVVDLSLLGLFGIFANGSSPLSVNLFYSCIPLNICCGLQCIFVDGPKEYPLSHEYI